MAKFVFSITNFNKIPKQFMDSNKINLISYLNTHGKNKSWHELAEQFGLKHGEIARSTWNNYKKTPSEDEVASVNYMHVVNNNPNYVHPPYNVTTSTSIDMNKGEAEQTFDSEEEIKTLEDLVRIGKIDTEIWNIDKYVQNYWGGKFQVKAFLSKKEVETNLGLQKEVILEEIKKFIPENSASLTLLGNQAFTTPVKTGNRLLELVLFDIHLGKLAWKDEVGEDYDLDIAVERYKAAVTELLDGINLKNVTRILLPVGNDFINIDYKQSTTTAGTPQNCDSRFSKIIQTAKKLLIDTINYLQNIAPVDVVIIPGNHDEHTMFNLGEILDAWYHNTPNVTIYNNPKLRKFYKFGTNGFMFTHGDKEKMNELGMIFAAEEPKLWGDTTQRFIQLGHFHHTKKVTNLQAQEFQGFLVQTMPSLSGTDAWHYGKGYKSLKQAKAFIFDENKGMLSEHTYTA